jgi:dihydroorotate dehydrogenase subfamily 2
MQKLFLKFYAFEYRNFFSKFLFLFDSEFIHEFIVNIGEKIGGFGASRNLIKKVFYVKNRKLNQTILGINFDNPIGLAAGFDYKAKLIKILPSLSFGFQTIGTITNHSYNGNPKPRLGRLIKSKSLMVNKGFKNPGIKEIVKKLQKNGFKIPVGLSIGKTNTTKNMSQQEAVIDIVSAFKIAECSRVNFSYYELNISCPNLFGDVDFYSPENLKELLGAVTNLKLKKPLFIKMPIEKTNDQTIKMLDVITELPIAGVIFGNLQKNRKDKAFDVKELKKFPVGNFSGKPTQQRSNELIELAYRNYGKKLVIIGCGGIFNAQDAYKKIKLGASLVQLITGLIFEGPQLIAQINIDLVKLLQKDGFINISEAIGKDVS